MRKIHKDIIKDYGIPVGTIVLTAIVSVIIQRIYISKAEENNLIRELIPALISDDARETDMALMLLKGELTDSKYENIEKIITKKVERIADENPVIKTSNTSSSTEPKIANLAREYAKLRPEWKEIVTAKQVANAPAFSKLQFLDLLETLDKKSSDKTVDAIIMEAAKAINNENYYRAYIAAYWAMNTLNVAGKENLVSISKICPNVEERKAIQNLDMEKFIIRHVVLYKFSNFVGFNEETVETLGETTDMLNSKFLEDLKDPKKFDWRPTPPPQPTKNKFEDVK